MRSHRRTRRRLGGFVGERWRAGFIILTAFVVALAAGVVMFGRPLQAEPAYTTHPTATTAATLPSTPMPTLPMSTLPPPPAPLVTLGDSITWDAWPDIVDSRDAMVTLVHNAGVPGNTTAQMLARLSKDVLAYSPEVVTVMGGTNDVGNKVAEATVIANLTAIVDALKAANVRVILLTIPPRTDPTFAEPIRSLNASIRTLAVSEGVALADIYPALAQTDGTYVPGLTRDGLHPSAAGNAAIASVVVDALRTAGY